MFVKYTLRIEPEVLAKLQFVAQYEGRTAAAQIRIQIRDCINAFEKEHGKIKIDENTAPQ